MPGLHLKQGLKKQSQNLNNPCRRECIACLSVLSLYYASSLKEQNRLKDMRISLIAAMASNRVIGKNGFIPWAIPCEQQRFKEITLKHIVILGRKTYESIGHPLQQRTNIVISRQVDYQAPGCTMAKSIHDALGKCPKDEEEVFICGGEGIYEESIALADRIYLSIIHREVCGDKYFPEFSLKEFRKVRSEYVECHDPYTFIIYDRIKR